MSRNILRLKLGVRITAPNGTITGSPPDAVVGQPYSFTFNVIFSDGVNRQTEIDSQALSFLSLHNISYNTTTHTLSSANVT